MTPTAQIQHLARLLPRDVTPWRLVSEACGVSRITAYRWLAMDPEHPAPLHRVRPPSQEQADLVAAAAQRSLDRLRAELNS